MKNHFTALSMTIQTHDFDQFVQITAFQTIQKMKKTQHATHLRQIIQEQHGNTRQVEEN